MKFFAFTLLGFAILFTGCKPPAAPTPPGNSNQAPPPSPVPAKAALTPGDVIKALNEAAAKKDPAMIKSHLSQGTLDMLNETAENQQQTPDEILTAEGGAPFSILPEILEEKVEGDKATVDVRMPGTTDPEHIPFVKENGEWKAALDVYTEELMKRATEQMKTTPGKSPQKK
jgi:hypothetical protein